MFYMAASLNDRTEQAAILDLEELQRVSGENSKLKEHVNLLVQIDRRWPGYAERYCIERGQSTFCEARYNERNVRDPDKNSGNRKVLKEFVQWGRKHSPAEHYMLVLWGHQYGLGFGRDHGNPLTLPEIEGALSDALKGEKLDILGANACAMSYVEAAYQLQNVADFLVAPEIAMPLAGWPYDKILAEIVNNPDIGAQEFGKTIVMFND